MMQRLLIRQGRRHGCRSLSSIGNFIEDAWHAKSLSPTNPFVELIERYKQPQEWNVSLSRVLPHHLEQALLLQDDELDLNGNDIIKLVAQWQLYKTKSQILAQTASVLSEIDQHVQWQIVIDEKLLKGKRYDDFVHVDDEATRKLYNILQDFCSKHKDDNNTGTEVAEALAVAKWFIQTHDFATGVSIKDEDEKITYHKLQYALQAKVPDLATSNIVQESLQTLYQVVGISNQQSKMLGYESTAHRVLSTQCATVADGIESVQTMIDELNEKLKPSLFEYMNSNPSKGLQSFLAPSGLESHIGRMREAKLKLAASEPEEEDVPPLQLKEYTNMKGTISVVSDTLERFFGMKLELVENVPLWGNNTSMYHVYDTNDQTYLGSIILDPLSNDTRKFAQQSFATSMVPRRWLPEDGQSKPLVCISANIKPPMWTTSPIHLDFDDLVDVFQEFGRACQLLARHDKPFVDRPLPIDLCEVAPKFMAQYLLKESTLLDLMNKSEIIDAEGGESAIRAFYAERNKTKVLELAQLNFYAALELELFHHWDIRGEEKMLQLQQRVAQKYTPHDIPFEKDTSAMDSIVREVATKRLGYFRYVWGEALAAQYWKRIDSASTNAGGNTAPLSPIHNVHELLLPTTFAHHQRIKEEIDTVTIGESGDTKRTIIDMDAMLELYRIRE